MSNLPHPLGDSVAGELFYPGTPDVVAGDIPGPAGSRAVEFGEDGVSSAINRGLWALGKNDEYLQARMGAFVAKMEFTSWGVSGGAGGSFVCATTHLFARDATYLPETQEILDSLISVLDDQYNELIDPVTGDKIVVKSIMNAVDAASIVGDTVPAGGNDDGFYFNGAIIRFSAVNPRTYAVTVPTYVIPDGTSVIFAHGISGQLDTLATPSSEHLMRNAFFKGCIRNAGEIHSASFLKDGNRPATGDFDLAGFDLHNVREVTNKTTLALDLISDAALTFKDEFLVFGIPLSQTNVSGMVGNKTSIMGGLVGQIETGIALHGGGRFLNRVGSFVYTDGPATIDYPYLDVIIKGEVHHIDAGQIVATDTGPVSAYLVVDNTGTVTIRTGGGPVVAVDDTIIEKHRYTAGAFVTAEKLDLRWPALRRDQTVEMTVGDAVGTDFTDLYEALTVADGLYGAWSGVSMAAPVTIKIKGNATLGALWSRTPTYLFNLTILGDGWDVSRITVTDPAAGIDMDGRQLLVKDLRVVYANAADMTETLFKDVGAYSRVESVNLTISGAGAGYKMVNTASNGVVVNNCWTNNWTSYLVTISGNASDCKVTDCYFFTDNWVSIPNAAILLDHTDNAKITRVRVKGPWQRVVEVLGSSSVGSNGLSAVISFCTAQFYATTPAAAVFVSVDGGDAYKPTVKVIFNRIEGYSHGMWAHNLQQEIDLDFSNNRVWSLSTSFDSYMVRVANSSTVTGGRIRAVGNHGKTSSVDDHMVHVRLASTDKKVRLEVLDNTWYDSAVAFVDGDIDLRVEGNYLHAPELLTKNVVRVDKTLGSPSTRVENNDFRYPLCHNNGVRLTVKDPHIIGNKFITTEDLTARNWTDGIGGDKSNTVESVGATSPPGGPTTGDRHIVGNSATGAWVGLDGRIVEYAGASWIVVTPIVPSDQTIVWNNADDSWYIHRGAHAGTYDGWAKASFFGIFMDDATIAEDWTSTIEDNTFVGGATFSRMGELWGGGSISFNYVRDCLGAGVEVVAASFCKQFRVVGNIFHRVTGKGLKTSSGDSGYIVKVTEGTVGGFAKFPNTQITNNIFDRCGPRWRSGDEVRMIWTSSAHVADNQILTPLFGFADGTHAPNTDGKLIYITDGQAQVHDNYIQFIYTNIIGLEPFTSNPYELSCIYTDVNSHYSSVQGNKLDTVGQPMAGTDDFRGITVLGDYSQVSNNNVRGIDGSLLSGINYGIYVISDGALQTDNLTGDVGFSSDQYYSSSGAPNGMVLGNRAPGGAFTFINQLPGTAVGAPVNLLTELNL